ncbi:TPA: hypothetical protein ACWLUJ_006157 [Pseudomonas aeruginosa]|nr:hypothetical protein [Pseudomonas aeruginosa]
MSKKPKSNSKFGQQNWIGDFDQPRLFTRYTIPGLLYWAGIGVARLVEYLLYMSAFMTVGKWVQEAAGFTATTHPITRAEWCGVAVAVAVAAFRFYRRATKRSRN